MIPCETPPRPPSLPLPPAPATSASICVTPGGTLNSCGNPVHWNVTDWGPSAAAAVGTPPSPAARSPGTASRPSTVSRRPAPPRPSDRAVGRGGRCERLRRFGCVGYMPHLLLGVGGPVAPATSAAGIDHEREHAATV